MMKQNILYIFLILLADRILKMWISSSMQVYESIPVIKDIFHITYVQNHGVAFSMFEGGRWLIVAFTAVVICIGIWYLVRFGACHWTCRFAMIFMIAGGIGNLIDRIIFGYVIDMFDFRIWPVFNIADIFVVTGAVVFVIHVLFFETEGRRN